MLRAVKWMGRPHERGARTRLRAITGGRAKNGHTLALIVRAFDDPTAAIQESVKALAKRGEERAVSVAAARDLLTDQRVQLGLPP